MVEQYVPSGLPPSLREKILKQLQNVNKQLQSSDKILNTVAQSVSLRVYSEIDYWAREVLKRRKMRERELERWAKKLHEQTEKEIQQILNKQKSGK